MQYRKLGRTGLEVSVLGYGAWGIGKAGWVGADDDESLRALRRGIERGVNFIDTALGYGNGHSETLVGQVVREAQGTVYMSTKIPPKNSQWPARQGVPANEAFPGDWVVEMHRTEFGQPGAGDDRRPAVPRVVRRVVGAGRLGRGD